MPRVAIVVVTHQSGDVIRSCLNALAHLWGIESDIGNDIETVVVDNASTDSTLSEVVLHRNVRLIANPRNEGFAAAVNRGVESTTAPLLLLLNPDAVLQTGIEALIECFDNPEIGAAGGLLIGSDGKPQTGFMARNLPRPATLIFEVLGFNRLWPKNPLNWHYRCLRNDPMTPAFVEQPAGAFFMFRRSVWQQLGGFDENFWPVWFEDVDFCARLRQAGLRVRYQPAARAIHQGGHSVGMIPREFREEYWYGSLLKYAAKHYSPVAFGSVCLAVAVGAAGRAILAFPRGGLRVFEVYSSVIRLSFAHLRLSLAQPRGAHPPGSRIAGPRRGK